MKRCIASSTFSSSSSSLQIPTMPVTGPEPEPRPRPVRRRVRAKKNVKADASAQPAERSSVYRGVTKHSHTKRYEAHLWDKSFSNPDRKKKGKQIYLGAYENEEVAARTYDLAALKYWGTEAQLNFPIERYAKEIEEMQQMSREEFLASLRRVSSGFARGVSKYRGVARHHLNDRWEARIGRVNGNKYLYLGTYSTQEEAAAAYDAAAVEHRGPTAVTNFDVSRYRDALSRYYERIQSQQQGPNTESSAELQQEVRSDPENAEDQNQIVCYQQVAEEGLNHHHHQQQQQQPMNFPAFENVGMEPEVPNFEFNLPGDNIWDSICFDVGPYDPFLEQSDLFSTLNQCHFDCDIDLMFDEGSSGKGSNENVGFSADVVGRGFEAAGDGKMSNIVQGAEDTPSPPSVLSPPSPLR